MPLTSMLSRLILFTALLVGHVCSSATPSSSATDAAFAALLTMPGAQPLEGGWVIPPQDKPTPGNERELIQRLQRLQKAGADFNAMRHRGTLLAHAIRAGKEQTAIWLLGHGASTTGVVFGGVTSAGQLAQKYQRAAVEKVLIDQYGFKPPTPASSPPSKRQSIEPHDAASPSSPREQARQLLSKKHSDMFPDKSAQKAWRNIADQLSPPDFADLFEKEGYLMQLLILTHETEGELVRAISRLSTNIVQQHAQTIANFMMEKGRVHYGLNGKQTYTPTARSWPALWNRLEKPLNYDTRPDLAQDIPPDQWPALFNSGYNQHQAKATGNLMGALDASTFKKLWPAFKQHFPDTEQEAPTLVLKPYLLSSVPFYGSTRADTLAKLQFLRDLGVTGRVVGLRNSLLSEDGDPALRIAAEKFLRPSIPPRLVKSPLKCRLAFNEIWLNALANTDAIDFGAPVQYVQALEVPGESQCALVLSSDRYPEWPEYEDDFDQGPFRSGGASCPDPADAEEYWIEKDGSLQHPAFRAGRCIYNCLNQKVEDISTGDTYWLSSSVPRTMCHPFESLPTANEWRSSNGEHKLVESGINSTVSQLLLEQCAESGEFNGIVCHGLESERSLDDPTQTKIAATEQLQKGYAPAFKSLVDELGAERKKAFMNAVENLDRHQIKALVQIGIPPWWTGNELQRLELAPIPLEAKRRRAALLFGNQKQLDRTLNRDFEALAESLMTWLPDQDWGPVLRFIGREPDLWRNAAGRLQGLAKDSNRSQALICRFDHALGNVCGGGIAPQ